MNTPEQPGDDPAPSLHSQTMVLGRTLKAIADEDPAGTPSEGAAIVFAEWLVEAGPASSRPGHFVDVAENYEVLQNSNKDLFLLFDMLVDYVEFTEDDFEPPAPRTFIGLPMADVR